MDIENTTTVVGTEERWAVVPGFEGYEASTHGRVRNARTGRVLRTHTAPGSYERLGLRRGKKPCSVFVHRVVLTAHRPSPDPSMFTQVNHRDGDKLNNALDNLEWSSPSLNLRHAARTGLLHGSQAKLTERQVYQIHRIRRDRKTPHAALARAYGVSDSNIRAILYGERWIDAHRRFNRIPRAHRTEDSSRSSAG